VNNHVAQAVEDMLINAEKALQYFQQDEAGWRSDELRVDAILRRVSVIGEAALRVSVPARERYPEIKWREIIGMRQRVVHGYDEVDLDILDEVLHHHLPELIAQLRAYGARG